VTIKCIVEIPKGSRNKYEYDAEAGGITLDRFLSSSVVYPTDYGFVPDTLALDGDTLDALVCVSEPTFPGCIVVCKPVGLFEMEDEKGIDSKVLCVPCADPGWNMVDRIDDLPKLLRDEIGQFFAIYKDLEPGKESKVKGWRDKDAALEEIASARERFRQNGGSGSR
jgi:inorganic pyrophosphatase